MYHNSTNCLIIASEATLVFIQDPKPCTFLIVSLCKCPTHMYIVFFWLHSQNSCWCTVSWHQGCLPSVHCTTHAQYAMWQAGTCWTGHTQLALLSNHYRYAATRGITLKWWWKPMKRQQQVIEASLLDTPPPTGTSSDQLPLMYLMSMTVCVCICSIQIHCGCIGFSSLSQVGRWLILCAPALCSWPKQKTKFQKCPAELSNH